MNKTNIRKIFYHVKHRYVTRENAIIAIAFVVAASWAWGSIGMMQRNYRLQQEVDSKQRQEQLVSLQVQNAKLEQRYYESLEYQEIEARRRMGLAYAGEKMLILPENTEQARAIDRATTARLAQRTAPESNMQQWTNFLFGGNRERLQK